MTLPANSRNPPFHGGKRPRDIKRVYLDLRKELTREQHGAYQELHQRRLRSDPVPRRGKRCRSVKDQSRLWKVAAALGCGTSAVSSLMPGSSSPVAAQDLIEINSVDYRGRSYYLLFDVSAGEIGRRSMLMYRGAIPKGTGRGTNKRGVATSNNPSNAIARGRTVERYRSIDSPPVLPSVLLCQEGRSCEDPAWGAYRVSFAVKGRAHAPACGRQRFLAPLSLSCTL